MRINLTLQQLQSFAEVAQRCNFREAAAALNVSQPALSRTIRMAEEALGTRLFDRDTRRVQLTPAGRELRPIAQRILAEFHGAFSDLAGFLAGRSGQVAVGALPSIGVSVLPALIARFQSEHPQVGFSMVEAPAGPLLQAVDDGSVDVAVTVRPEPDARLRYQHVLDDPFVLLCRRDDPLARRRTASWRAFADRPFIAAFPQSSIRPVTDAVFLQQGLQVHAPLTYPSIAAAGALVQTGLGITALPRMALRLIATEGLVAVPLQRPAMHRPLGLVTRIGRTLSPVAQAFVPLLARALKAESAQRWGGSSPEGRPSGMEGSGRRL
jgi:DNA-binding transcriptional LysR family regulator